MSQVRIRPMYTRIYSDTERSPAPSRLRFAPIPRISARKQPPSVSPPGEDAAFSASIFDPAGRGGGKVDRRAHNGSAILPAPRLSPYRKVWSTPFGDKRLEVGRSRARTPSLDLERVSLRFASTSHSPTEVTCIFPNERILFVGSNAFHDFRFAESDSA